MGNDAPTDMPLKSNFTFIKGSPHSKTMFEGAQACFDARSPTLATPEPALFLPKRAARA
jgi:hypothetical protein